jgi:hypothetical protein
MAVATTAALAAFGVLATSASAAEKTLTLRTKAGVLGASSRIEGAGTFSLTASGKTVTCADSALEGLAVLSNEAATDRDELFFDGIVTRGVEEEGRCKSAWHEGSSVEVEFEDHYFEVLFEASGHAAIIGSCEEGCHRLDMDMHFTGVSDCTYEFQSVPLKFKPGTAGHPKALTATATDKVKPTFATVGCPTSFTLKAKYTFTVGGERLESEAV